MQTGDDARIEQVLEPLNADGRFLVQRCLRPDGSPQLVRVVDMGDRHTDEQDLHDEEMRAVARVLREGGFEAYEIPMSRSEWGDIEIHERR